MQLRPDPFLSREKTPRKDINMSKCKDFLDRVAFQEPNSLRALANEMQAAGDDRLHKQLEAGSAKGINEGGLIALAYALKLNGDDRLWKQLDLESRVSESVEVRAQVETVKALHKG